jgi:hypothetical protein
MTTFPDSDPATAPRPDGPGGDQDALESPQVPDVTSPEAATPPTEEHPADQPGGTPPAPAHPNGAAAAAGSLLELALTELQGRRAGLLAEIAALDANVVDVSHMRTNPRLAVDEVEITIGLETRGPEHRDQLLARLTDDGYQIVSAE